MTDIHIYRENDRDNGTARCRVMFVCLFVSSLDVSTKFCESARVLPSVWFGATNREMYVRQQTWGRIRHFIPINQVPQQKWSYPKTPKPQRFRPDGMRHNLQHLCVLGGHRAVCPNVVVTTHNGVHKEGG